MGGLRNFCQACAIAVLSCYKALSNAQTPLVILGADVHLPLPEAKSTMGMAVSALALDDTDPFAEFGSAKQITSALLLCTS
jgi:hypothetical protein